LKTLLRDDSNRRCIARRAKWLAYLALCSVKGGLDYELGIGLIGFRVGRWEGRRAAGFRDGGWGSGRRGLFLLTRSWSGFCF